jgi:spore coat protein H
MKRPFACFSLLLILVSVGWLGSPAPDAADGQTPVAASDEFFDSGKIIELVIDVDAKELAALGRDPRKYVKATVKEGDKVYKDVGIHLKGAAGSFRGFDDKPGLTLSMGKFALDQRFHGMHKFHLANSVQDPSYLSELICGELFRAAGVPASRVGHAVVTLNGKRRGLYYIKEGFDKHFLTRHFGNRHGNFYDGGFLRDLDQPLQRLSGKDDVKEHADLKKLMAAAGEKNVKERFAKMAEILDMDRFISYMAMEVITWDWDGYPMNRNNYRIYHDPKRDKLVFLPSGMDQMFAEPSGTLFPNFQGAVARAVMETPEGRKRYIARVDEIMKKSYNADALVKRLDELQPRVQRAMATIDAGAGRDYPNHVKRLRDAVKQREKNVPEQLRKLKV